MIFPLWIFQTIYNMGQTKVTNSAEDAIKDFLEREYTELLQCSETPHKSIFIPESYVYGGIAAKVTFLSYFFYWLP
jgi:hypothetical protein